MPLIDAPLFIKGLDLLITGLGLIGLAMRYKTPKNSLSTKDMLKMLEQRDKEIARLQIEIQAWKMHHEQLTNKDSTCN